MIKACYWPSHCIVSPNSELGGWKCIYLGKFSRYFLPISIAALDSWSSSMLFMMSRVETETTRTCFRLTVTEIHTAHISLYPWPCSLGQLGSCLGSTLSSSSTSWMRWIQIKIELHTYCLNMVRLPSVVVKTIWRTTMGSQNLESIWT